MSRRKVQMSRVSTASRQRAGDDLAVGVAGDRGDVGVEAHRDERDLALELGAGDHRLLDRDQAVVERLPVASRCVDRGGEGVVDMRRRHAGACSSRSPFQKASRISR